MQPLVQNEIDCLLNLRSLEFHKMKLACARSSGGSRFRVVWTGGVVRTQERGSRGPGGGT